MSLRTCSAPVQTIKGLLESAHDERSGHRTEENIGTVLLLMIGACRSLVTRFFCFATASLYQLKMRDITPTRLSDRARGRSDADKSLMPG